MKRRDIHMHAVYVQGLNRIWQISCAGGSAGG